ncbi:MAG: hypothetical protein LBT24_04430 [Tannerella sp.]|jgi:hypothetical protein|nr:hypothetical protein [Tannerella sp.]
MTEQLKETRVTRQREDGRVITGRLVETGVSTLFLPDIKTKKEAVEFLNRAGIFTKKGKLTAPYRRTM